MLVDFSMRCFTSSTSSRERERRRDRALQIIYDLRALLEPVGLLARPIEWPTDRVTRSGSRCHVAARRTEINAYELGPTETNPACNHV